MSTSERNSSVNANQDVGRGIIYDTILILSYVALFSVYTAVVLALTDFALAKFLPDYQYSGRYGFGVVIFFLAATAFSFFCRWRGWNNWRYFVLGGLTVFFPLVFTASTVRMFIGGEGSMIHGYALQYCNGIDAAIICGEAFAASVFTMSLRALPTVFTIPLLYWYLLVYRPGKKRQLES